jgi:glycosyltransferase involved in cell wall biosynthesis
MNYNKKVSVIDVWNDYYETRCGLCFFDERKKVLIISPFNPNGIGGAETFVKELIKEAEKKFRVTLLTRKKKVKGWDNTNFLLGAIWAFELSIRAIILQLRYKYNTIHSVGTIGLLVGVVLKKIFKIRLIATTLAIYKFNEFPYWKYRILSYIYKQADMIFVEDDLGFADMCHLNIDANKVEKFMHWVDLDLFKPDEKYKSGKLTVIFVGRPIYKKGKHIIEEVEKRLKNEEIEFIYVENVSQQTLSVYYKKSDIFCIPSIYAEGVSRAVLEASASGCVVLASNYGSLKDLIFNFGLVFEPTVNNFEREILMLNRNRILLNAMQEETRKYAEKHFSKNNAQVFFNKY